MSSNFENYNHVLRVKTEILEDGFFMCLLIKKFGPLVILNLGKNDKMCVRNQEEWNYSGSKFHILKDNYEKTDDFGFLWKIIEIPHVMPKFVQLLFEDRRFDEEDEQFFDSEIISKLYFKSYYHKVIASIFLQFAKFQYKLRDFPIKN